MLGLLEQNAGRWGEITVRKDTIQVADVQEGAEDILRHLLESALLQVNTDFEPNPEQDAPEAERDPESTIDQGMSDTFRGFADNGDLGLSTSRGEDPGDPALGHRSSEP